MASFKMISEILAGMQVGYKSMLYMHLHAEAVLNLVESSCREIQFRQVSGDFQLLQGKFILQDAIPPEVSPSLAIVLPSCQPLLVVLRGSASLSNSAV